MRAMRYSTNARLPERDLYDLADALALQLHNSFGPRVYLLQRSDVAELVAEYISDLHIADQRSVPWIIWHLFQDAFEIDSVRQY